ncbi:MAG: guanine deaminase, partial [Sediminicola sp.]
SCEPCPMCLGAIYWAHLKQVFFACDREDAAAVQFDDQFIYDELKKDMGDREIKFVCLLRKEGVKVFEQWANKTNKIAY